MKCAILGPNTSNILTSNSLSPVLTNFMTYPISPLSATLTQFETSVLGVKIQVSPNQKTSLTKVVRHDKGMIKISSAPPEELGKPAKRVS